MTRSLIVAEAFVALALASGAAWPVQGIAATPLMAANTVAQPGAADYEIGYRDALNKQPYRDASRKNVRYGEGFNAGTAKQKALAAEGADYDLGYRDGYNRAAFRDATRKNVRYAEGYKAGGSDRGAPAVAAPPPATAAVPGAPAVAAAAAPAVATARGADYDLGYRDALNKQPHRDASHKNVRYGEGYAAGQAKSQAIAASGPDYELGFRDGFNKAAYRDRDRKNKRYADGFSAGQSERAGAASASVAAPPPPPKDRFEGLEPGRIVIDK